MKKVEKVTKDEIVKVLPAVSTATASPSRPKKNLSTNQYISRLSMKNLEDFFRPFNVQTIEKFPDEANPEFIYVACENFEVTFNDYDIAFQITSPIDDKMNSSGDFDFYSFLKYCDTVDIYPDQAMSTLISTELLGKRFDGYAVDREKQANRTADEAFSRLPKATRRILRPIDDAIKNENAGKKNYVTFGTSNIEDLIRRDAE